MRISARTECPGKNRRRGEQKFVTAEDVIPLVADIANNPQEYFVCPTNRLRIDGKMLAHFPRLNSIVDAPSTRQHRVERSKKDRGTLVQNVLDISCRIMRISFACRD